MNVSRLKWKLLENHLKQSTSHIDLRPRDSENNGDVPNPILPDPGAPGVAPVEIGCGMVEVRATSVSSRRALLPSWALKVSTSGGINFASSFNTSCGAVLDGRWIGAGLEIAKFCD